MPPGKNKKKSIHAGGYSEAGKQRLESVQLPDKTRCKRCKRMKGIANFSNKQILNLRNDIAMGASPMGGNTGLIACRQCTGLQIHEMTCIVCDQVKSLEGFSKAQRKDPDYARCLGCVDGHLHTNPSINADLEDTDEEDDGVSNPYEDSRAGSEDDAYERSDSNGERFGQMNHEENTRPFASVSNSGIENVSRRNGNASGNNDNQGNGSVWMGFARSNGLNSGRGTTEYTGYDDRGTGHARVRVASTVASDDSFPSLVSKPQQSRFNKSKGSKFAREPAVPLPRQSFATAANAKGRQVVYDHSEGEDDWGELP